MDSHAFLQNLAVVLCVAAVATVVFQRLRQPLVRAWAKVADVILVVVARTNNAALRAAAVTTPVARRMPSPD